MRSPGERADQANLLSGSWAYCTRRAARIAKAWPDKSRLAVVWQQRERPQLPTQPSRCGILDASMNPIDRLLVSLDNALRTRVRRRACGAAQPGRPPARRPTWTTSERRAVGRADARQPCRRGLRPGAVPGAGADGAQRPSCARRCDAAAREETDHLAWTQQRLAELGDRTSLLNPLWYAGAFGIGLLAGRLGDRVSLGFVVETERQVEQHLAGHLDRLPAADARSRAIVDADEGRRAPPRRRRAGRRRRAAAGAGALADARRGQGDDGHRAPRSERGRAAGAAQASTISKLVVISAVLPSMMLAEQ